MWSGSSRTARSIPSLCPSLTFTKGEQNLRHGVTQSLAKDRNDGTPADISNFPPEFAQGVAFWLPSAAQPFLTDEQEALLGCGRFYGTQCDIDGIDLMNAEASALMQSFPGFPGSFGTHWDTRDTSVAQPGTVGFRGGPVCTRYENGRLYILPGCRAPGRSRRGCRARPRSSPWPGPWPAGAPAGGTRRGCPVR